jgi:hypothetical protein
LIKKFKPQKQGEHVYYSKAQDEKAKEDGKGKGKGEGKGEGITESITVQMKMPGDQGEKEVEKGEKILKV